MAHGRVQVLLGCNNLTVSNGMAAMPAWRSGISRWCMFDYGSQMGTQSGTSVIEATSPGLTSSSVTIQSQGSPAWVEGVTKPVAPRPYQP
jgi:hypothetical protein